jgi:hypothetical protein
MQGINVYGMRYVNCSVYKAKEHYLQCAGGFVLVIASLSTSSVRCDDRRHLQSQNLAAKRKVLRCVLRRWFMHECIAIVRNTGAYSKHAHQPDWLSRERHQSWYAVCHGMLQKRIDGRMQIFIAARACTCNTQAGSTSSQAAEQRMNLSGVTYNVFI